MPLLANAQMSVASAPGTGTNVPLGNFTTGSRTWQQAGAVSGQTYSYRIEEGVTWEIGVGTYSDTGPMLARTTILASSYGNTAVNFGAGAIVSQVALPADFPAAGAMTNYFPGLAATGGTINSATVRFAKYQKINAKLIFVVFEFVINDAGSAAGNNPILDLPFVGTGVVMQGSGREGATTGYMFSTTQVQNQAKLVMQYYGNTGMIANGMAANGFVLYEIP